MADKEKTKTQPPKKKRKTVPFSQLLTNTESLHLLREAKEEAERVANDKKEKKRGSRPKTSSTGDKKGAEARNSKAKKRRKGTYDVRKTAY